jgi:hypothetical protein
MIMNLYKEKSTVIYIFSIILLGILCGAAVEAATESRPPGMRATQATAYDQNVTVNEDGEVEIKLEAAGPQGVVLTYGLSRASRGKLSEVKGNVVTYKPYRNYYGTDQFRFSAYSKSPRLNSNYATVSITVNPLPDEPFAQDVEAITMQNAPIEIDLVGFDADGDDLKYSVKSQPINGQLKLIDESRSVYLYTPEQNFAGEDSFTFDANDGNSISNPAKVKITVLGESQGFLMPLQKSVYAKSALDPLKVETPVDLVIDRNDNLYILSAPAGGKSEVLVCNLDLQVQRRFTVDASGPRGIAVSDNNLYITDTGGNRVLRYSGGGSLDTSFGHNGSIGKHGSGDGEFDKPWAVGVDYKGNIYISDSGNNRVQIFNDSGKFKSKWQQKADDNVKSGSRNLIIRDEREERAHKEMLSQPRQISGFDQIRVEDRVPIKKPTGFFLGAAEEMFLADMENHKIKMLSAESGYLYSACGKKGSALGYFNMPSDTAYDLEMDQLVVADSGNNRIAVLQLRSRGEFFSSNAMTCVQEISDQNLSNPLGVAVVTKQPNQFIYVADTGNNRVVKMQNGLFKSGTSPVDVWEQFKDALLADDVDKALTFIISFKREDYAKILKNARPHLKEFVGGMRDLVPSSQEAGAAEYELLSTDPNGNTLSFPVHFVMDDDGNWKIMNF